MPTMIPMASIRVIRDGKAVVPPVGKPFDFTKDEIRDVKAHAFHAIRLPENESVALTETELLSGRTVEEDADKIGDANMLSKSKAKQKGARNQGGATAAAAEDDDDETL